jgi:GT2 family glycosyltransferase
VAVVIPTWKRPHYLRLAIAAVAGQSYPASAVYAVVRTDDEPTWELLRQLPAAIAVPVRRPGFLAPLVAAQHALRDATEDLVAIFDDDCEPDANFLERVVALYRDPSVAGVGGRCLSYFRGEPILMSPARRVGRIDWLGRAFGGMSVEPSVPGVREVDFIMGGAGTYRRQLFCSFQFPREMDRDVAYGYEQFVGSQARRHGRLLYEPSAFVIHHTAEREAIGMRPVDAGDEAQRQEGVRARTAGAWNSAFALWHEVRGFKRIIVCASFLLIGSSEFPGPVYRLIKPWRRSLLGWRAAARAKIDGFRCAARGQWTALTIEDVR